MDVHEYMPEYLEHLAESSKDYGRVLPFDQWEGERDKAATLTKEEMLLIIDTAISLLEGLYVHMDLKRARRGVDPVRQLRMLMERKELTDGTIGQRIFHRTLLEIFKSLGDVHTAYRLPDPYKRAIAFLPFLLNTYQDAASKRRYVVSHALAGGDREPSPTPFHRGVEVTTWNGVPIGDAVRRSAEFEEGSNLPHDLALGLQFMTVRWLGASFESDSPWVVVGYEDNGRYLETKFFWSVLLFNNDPGIAVVSQAAGAVLDLFRPAGERQRALDVGGGIVHAGRMALFLPERKKKPDEIEELDRLAVELRTRFYGYIGRKELREFTNQHRVLKPNGDEVPSLLPEFCEARVHGGDELVTMAGDEDPYSSAKELLTGKRFGYIGLRGFPLIEPARSLFKYELRRLLSWMPSDGLILDIRDNPGGSATTAEEALQFLTPNPVTPLPFSFIASPLTKELVNPQRGLFPEYRPSIDTAVSNGARFSAGRPLTSLQRANALGQHYFGPVLLLTNAMTYSAADIFAAGFEDNEIGPILGLDETTGAGGANCWFYQQYISQLLEKPLLPHGINLQIAVRQCARVGKDNAGVPIEEIGVESRKDRRYALTLQDILGQRPWRLLLTAARDLALRPQCDLETLLVEKNNGRELTVLTRQIERLDFYVDGLPTSVPVTTTEATTSSPLLPANRRVELEIRGFAHRDGVMKLVARYVQIFPN